MLPLSGLLHFLQVSQILLPEHSNHKGLGPLVTNVSLEDKRAVATANCPKRTECHTQEASFVIGDGDSQWTFVR